MIADVLNRLEAVRPRSEADSWTARCPAHDDKRNSLAVAIRGGRVLFHCFAGCSRASILAAVSLDASRISSAGKVPARFAASRPAQVFEAPYLAAMSLPGLSLTSDWTYRYADGSPAFVVCRLERADGGKEIRPIKPVAGGWSWGLPHPPRPLYRLPEVLEWEGAVVVTEGEKAADAAARAGWCATTSAGGASAASKTDWSPLAGRRVVVWPDNDEPGIGYAQQVAATLRDFGCAVSVVEPIGGKGDDAADCGDVDSVLAITGRKVAS